MITIIDYGMGNIGSLENMIKKAGGKSLLTRDHEIIEQAKKLILPGVGAFDNAISKLKEYSLYDAIDKKVTKDKIPILCICLGAQLITESSEEGLLNGFSWIKSRSVKFAFDASKNIKIPHMGWNDVTIKKESRLFENMYDDPCFYFVHSYHILCENPSDILTTSFYGREFVSSIEHDNIYATQFHPEKSHKYGLRLIQNFINNIN